MNQLKLNSIIGSLNVITGCASGLGKATLEWFLKRGSGPILGIDRHIADDFQDTLDLTDEQKSKLLLRQHDTFDVAKVDSSLEEFVSKHGSIDNLINVAGVALAFTIYSAGSKSIYDLKHTRDLIQFNTVGTFNMIRSASRFMIDSSQGSKPNTRPKCIVNASCISTTKPSIGQTFYAGSKSAIDSMTLCVAREFAPLNIRCNTINVGYFNTKLMRSSDERVIKYIEKDVVLCPRRLGQPEEFAHLVQAIVENSMLNGCCIKLDGCAEPALVEPHSGKNSQTSPELAKPNNSP